jgi:hypothetical protein
MASTTTCTKKEIRPPLKNCFNKALTAKHQTNSPADQESVGKKEILPPGRIFGRQWRIATNKSGIPGYRHTGIPRQGSCAMFEAIDRSSEESSYNLYKTIVDRICLMIKDGTLKVGEGSEEENE